MVWLMKITPLDFQALIFDMDGILIHSEPFWREAEIELFKTVGVELDEAECAQTMGLRVDEVVALRAPHANQKELIEKLEGWVERLIRAQGQPLEGVVPVLERVRAVGWPCALATSSSQRLLRATLERLQLKDFFQITHSAETEPLGKPHPAVYLSAAAKLGVRPTDCLAIEDSVNGVIAAKAARMKVVAIPEADFREDPRLGIADLKLDSLTELLPFL